MPLPEGSRAGLSDPESANRFLDEKYLRAFNRQFARQAASPVDMHRAAPWNWNEVLSWEAERVVQNDWTVACEGKRYQLDRQHEALSLVRRKVIVRTLRDGRVQLVYHGKALQWRELPAWADRVVRPGIIRGGETAWAQGSAVGTESKPKAARCGWPGGPPVGLRYDGDISKEF